MHLQVAANRGKTSSTTPRPATLSIVIKTLPLSLCLTSRSTHCTRKNAEISTFGRMGSRSYAATSVQGGGPGQRKMRPNSFIFTTNYVIRDDFLCLHHFHSRQGAIQSHRLFFNAFRRGPLRPAAGPGGRVEAWVTPRRTGRHGTFRIPGSTDAGWHLYGWQGRGSPTHGPGSWPTRRPGP